MANNHFNFNSFSSRPELVESLSTKIVDSLALAIEKKGYATLALSGGSTPVKLFQNLSNIEFDWEKVRVTLVDERWAEASSDKSNEKLIRDNLLINKAKMARFFALKTDEKFAKESVTALCVTMEKLSLELDVVILGMGLDGHTASFFPHAKELSHALSTNDLVCATTATVEPKERMTLSKNYLLTAQDLILHIEGSEKKDVFEKASRSEDESNMPIISMMKQKEPLLEVYYAD